MLITFPVHEHAKAATPQNNVRWWGPNSSISSIYVLVSMYIGDGDNFYREFSRDYILVC